VVVVVVGLHVVAVILVLPLVVAVALYETK